MNTAIKKQLAVSALVISFAIAPMAVRAQKTENKDKEKAKKEVMGKHDEAKEAEIEQEVKDSLTSAGQAKAQKPHEKGQKAKTEGQATTKPEGEEQGHAYGKDKGELKGKEFGQQRSQDAKQQTEDKKAALTHSKTEAAKKVTESKEKIAAAKAKLEKDKKEKKINDAQYKERKEKIAKAEKAVTDLETKISDEAISE